MYIVCMCTHILCTCTLYVCVHTCTLYIVCMCTHILCTCTLYVCVHIYYIHTCTLYIVCMCTHILCTYMYMYMYLYRGARNSSSTYVIYIQQWLHENEVETLEWPPQSPDLNPIEHVWEHMEIQLKFYSATTVTQLSQNLELIWSKIPAEFLKELTYSMPSRIEAVIKARGGHTKY